MAEIVTISGPAERPDLETFISLSRLADTLERRKDNVKKALEVLAEKEPMFTLHLWKCEELDTLGRPFDSYLLPYEEAMFFASTCGYKYAKDVYKRRPGREAKFVEIAQELKATRVENFNLRVANKVLDETVADSAETAKNSAISKASLIKTLEDLKNELQTEKDKLEAIFEAVSGTPCSDVVAKAGRSVARGTDKHFRTDWRELAKCMVEDLGDGEEYSFKERYSRVREEMLAVEPAMLQLTSVQSPDDLLLK